MALPGRRLGAYFMDSILPLGLLVFALVSMIIGASAGAIAVAAGESEEVAAAGVLVGVVGPMCLWMGYAVWALFLFPKGTTPGKNLLGMYVIREDGTPPGFFTMLVRETVGKWLSGLVIMLGYLSIVTDQDNQGWHDKLLNTYVVRIVAK